MADALDRAFGAALSSTVIGLWQASIRACCISVDIAGFSEALFPNVKWAREDRRLDFFNAVLRLVRAAVASTQMRAKFAQDAEELLAA